MIVVENLTVNYGPVRAVRGIDLRVERPEIVSLVGPSGCGKSSVANAVAKLIPYGGRISAPDRIGVVFQSYALFPFMTCGDNIGSGLLNLSRGARRKKVDELLELVGLPGYLMRYPGQLSGGEQQRVAIARALAPEPSCLIMDEPFAAVDVLLRESFANWLNELLTSRPLSVLFISHDPDEVVHVSDRIVVIDRGKIVQTFNIDIPRPRPNEIRDYPRFIELSRAVKRTIMETGRNAVQKTSG